MVFTFPLISEFSSLFTKPVAIAQMVLGVSTWCNG